MACKLFIASCIPNIISITKKAIAQRTSSFQNNFQIVELIHNNKNQLDKESFTLIPDVEILFADPNFISEVISHPQSKVKWVQSTFAGVDKVFAALDNMQKIPEFVLTRHTAGLAQYMGEFVLGQIISRERQFPLMNELQKQKSFDNSIVGVYRGLDELTVGVIGVGNIGAEICRLCSSFNMNVLAAVRDERFKETTSLPNVQEVFPMSQLGNMLENCDYIVNILPSTSKTKFLLSGDVLQACSNRKAVLMNVGRGDVIDEDSLVQAIRNGWIGGAILDVFLNEPLPTSSRLWDLPGVTVTPHVSAVTEGKKAVKTFVDNLENYLSNKPLNNLVNLQKGY